MIKKLIIGVGALTAAGVISMMSYVRKKCKPLYK
jgi:predicted small secreted protein